MEILYLLNDINVSVILLKLRKEADDIGPAAELDHWKQRMAKFNRSN